MSKLDQPHYRRAAPNRSQCACGEPFTEAHLLELDRLDRLARTSRCNCESMACPHTQAGKLCDEIPAGRWFRMDYVGAVCSSCADRIIADGGAEFLQEVQS